MAEGWSIKQLHCLIMLSSVYQESSAGNPRFAQIDPETNDEDRVTLLYEPAYQRDSTLVEIKLGLNFIVNSPEYEKVPNMFIPKQPRPRVDQKLQASFASLPTGEHKPLTPWEKYAHALLQANEAMFVN